MGAASESWRLAQALFVVGLDGGSVLGEGKPDAGEGVHVRIGDVVDELPDGPAALAVGGVELAGGERDDGFAEVAGKLGQVLDGVAVEVGSDGGREDGTADGIARVSVGMGLHGLLLLESGRSPKAEAELSRCKVARGCVGSLVCAFLGWAW